MSSMVESFLENLAKIDIIFGLALNYSNVSSELCAYKGFFGLIKSSKGQWPMKMLHVFELAHFRAHHHVGPAISLVRVEEVIKHGKYAAASFG